MLGTLLLAFVAGLVCILSPCVLPLAPIVVAGARARDPRGPLAMAAGLAATFGLVGGTLASLGIELGSAGWIRAASALLMVLIGLAMLVPVFNARAERALAPLVRWSDVLARRLPAAGLLGQAAAGVVLAFAWAPCIGPTIGAAFALAAKGGSLPAAMATMTVFALGAATSLLAAGYGLGRLATGGRRLASRFAAASQALLGFAFFTIGVLILSGLDRRIEGVLVQAMPDWLVLAVTKV